MDIQFQRELLKQTKAFRERRTKDAEGSDVEEEIDSDEDY